MLPMELRDFISALRWCLSVVLLFEFCFKIPSMNHHNLSFILTQKDIEYETVA